MDFVKWLIDLSTDSEALCVCMAFKMYAFKWAMTGSVFGAYLVLINYDFKCVVKPGPQPPPDPNQGSAPVVT
jgi:hypothetical protein